MIQKEWVNGIDDDEQPRFQNVKDCRFAKVLGDQNRWYIKEITERSDSVKEDGDEMRFLVIRNITTAVAREIKEGRFGAQATSDPGAQQGYYLLKFSGKAYTDQETGKLMCDGHYYNEVRGQTGAWFTPGPYHVSVEVVNIVNGNVKVENMSENNLPYYKVHDKCKKRESSESI